MTASTSSSPDDSAPTLFRWACGEKILTLGAEPALMGIVNVTPDSFSDGGDFLAADTAVEHGLKLADQGADILDVGGESTRPGAAEVPVEEELSRTIPVIAQLVEQTSLPISIDTTKAEVARQALDAGASIVNDISGLTRDPQMPQACANSCCGVICMHSQGTPQTMQENPTYNDVVEDIRTWLSDRLDELSAAGIDRERLAIDPGIGFGKTAEHNLQILSHISRFRDLGHPVLIGHSRKRFLGKVLGKPIDERLFGTVGVAVALAMQSTDIIRVHDIAATRDCLTAWKAIIDRI